MGVFAALIVMLFAAHPGGQSVRAGVMVTSAGNSVLAMEGPVLGVGTPLTVVTTEDPQRVWQVVVVKQLADSPVMTKHNMPGPYYEIASESGPTPLPDLAVAVLGRPHVERIGAAVRLRVSNPPMGIRVRSCTSSEGLHLTLWAGEPLRSPRLWHTYFYLGYDVQPTCQQADIGDGSPAVAPDGRRTSR